MSPVSAFFAGHAARFPHDQMMLADGTRLKVPHMGWNEVQQQRPHALWDGIADGARFYFVAQLLRCAGRSRHRHRPDSLWHPLYQRLGPR